MFKLPSVFPFIVTMAVSVAVCEIFSVKERHDLENQVGVACATFYWSAIANIALSCAIFALFDVTVVFFYHKA